MMMMMTMKTILPLLVLLLVLLPTQVAADSAVATTTLAQERLRELALDPFGLAPFLSYTPQSSSAIEAAKIDQDQRSLEARLSKGN